ncbi:dihydropteroate synthase [Weeksella virosa]|uniref:dihydropteroate synthase n=1 Tax=Weeksella virosa (strain ATCC 43766 / DSM 16922 / JCM 21250 / CCUG 30538 / CDC 9751 / IAM 14551 / NBRC 16016 / NCTC 11634 / CL345/78) TaxID=865938 RepID=F0NYS2_WEEVC|nr:dihydropteroate synthase [Weeksella virosa]ADX68203.1 dihydropteroate synthase [Weeksella virosa DSM 16922]MDK7674842.1 dihydropteroate synthase [Weeksella virosa]SUP54516.1 Dihydropteroate synthase [Weeksella virosa]VEH64160.1 Dihydropteroate synthase [Weeksella virosa]
MTINCKGTLVDLSTPKVMGILNVTPDSFYQKGRTPDIDSLLKKAEKHLADGATFLDLGGYSTQPGAKEVSVEEELDRIIPAVDVLQNYFPDALLSIDTFRSQVAQKSVEAGAHIINDVSGGTLDEQMFSTIGQLQVPYVLMHMKATPQTMQINPQYEDVVTEVNQFLLERVQQLQRLKVKDIILDPGFGFAKTLEHNYQLLDKMQLIGFEEFPILVGVSRKSMVYKLLNITAEESLNATTALHMIALQKGAKILRVHDVKEARQAIEIYQMLRKPI